MCKNLTILTSFFLFSFVSVFSQNIYILHPSVGDTIDQIERENYLLFNDIHTEDCRFIVIKETSDNYFIECINETEIVSVNKVEVAELNKYANNIDKIDKYWESLMLEEQTKDELIDVNSSNYAYDVLDLKLVKQEDLRIIKSSTKVEWHRKKAQERIDNIKKGHMF